MKKLMLLVGLFSFLAIGAVDAQKCSHAKSSTTKTTEASVDDTAAAQAASLNENIERKVCEHSGKVSYYEKNVCEKSGKVSLNEVEWCTKSSKFVNVSPSENEKATCIKSASATKTSAKKGCCASSKKASCATKSKASCGSKGELGTRAVNKDAKAVKVKEVSDN